MPYRAAFAKIGEKSNLDFLRAYTSAGNFPARYGIDPTLQLITE
ncbi:MAG: hypothetical protein ABFS56_08360 [Pseudomonadota bacterium]